MKAIQVQTDTQQVVYIEISEDINPVLIPSDEEGGIAGAGDKAICFIKNLQEVGDAIASVCRTLHNRIETTLATEKPRELTLEFGVKLAGSAGIPLVTNGSAEGTFKVTAKWNF